MPCISKRTKCDVSFWRAFEPHPGQTFTFREAICGETTQTEQERKNMKDNGLDGLQDVNHDSLLGRKEKVPSVLPMWSRREKICIFGILAVFTAFLLYWAIFLNHRDATVISQMQQEQSQDASN